MDSLMHSSIKPHNTEQKCSRKNGIIHFAQKKAEIQKKRLSKHHMSFFFFLSHQLRNYVVMLKINIHTIPEFQYQEPTFEEKQALGFGIQKIKVGSGPFTSLVKSVLY